MVEVAAIEKGQEQRPDVLQDNLRREAAAIFGVTPESLSEWQINRIREDGAIDAHVPIEQLDVEGIPVDPLNVERLIDLFNERFKEKGGTGQRDPVVAGHVPGDKFYTLDGFHRHAVQTVRGETHLHATVEPNLTYEEVVKRRLEYANTHPEIEFARQVEMIQSVWDRTPWSDSIPNVLTAFRAFQDNYGDNKTDDVGLIDSLDDDDYGQIRDWVARICDEWGHSPAQIRENLSRVEKFDADLMRLVYKGRRVPPVGRISLNHVDVINKTYPGEFDMQRAVVELVIAQELTPRETEELISEVETSDPVYAEDIEEAAKVIDFLALKTRSRNRLNKGHKKSPAANVSAEYRGPEIVPSEVSVSGLLKSIRARLPDIQKDAFEGDWTQQEFENALEIGLVFTEILAQLTTQPQPTNSQAS